MKKVAIITTHRCDNFGAALQAYSLVMACRELGGDAVLLDWRSPYFERLYHRAYRYYRNPITSLKRMWAFVGFGRQMRKEYSEFRKLMPVSRPLMNLTQLSKAGMEFDAFIVGSDQVWNPLNSSRDAYSFDRANLLTFTDRPKFAYAASIGVSSITPSNLLPEFVCEWQKFKLITMREYEGAEFVSNATGKHVQTVCDPVLLHDAVWWSRLYSEQIGEDKVVFVYDIGNDSTLRTFAKDLAKRKGAKVVSALVSHEMWIHDKTTVSIGPIRFLQTLANAEAVVTNSFHASALSVIFGRQLYLQRTNNPANPNTRFSSLCKITELNPEEVLRYGNSSLVHINCAAVNRDKFGLERARSLALLRGMVL